MQPIVTKAEIVSGRYENTVMVELSDGSIRDAFSYFWDELCFDESEFLGKTLEQCNKLKFNKDVAYLRS